MRTDLLKCVTIAFCLAGCASDAECPDDYKLDGYCSKVEMVPDAGNGDGDEDAGNGDEDAGPSGDGDGDGDGDVCALEPEFEGGFGSPCTDAVNHSECSCEADYCAFMPGSEEGYCSATDCLDNPENCPEGWTCFDLAFTGMDLSVCLPPAQ
jgi:hypothetical protein